VHGFVLRLSADAYRGESARDLWLRLMASTLALLAVAGVAVAWRGLERSTALQVRLARAAEQNARLKEMNLAAAGLAHETRNPLNVVRGLAQMIGGHVAAPSEVRGHAADIVEEVDRVTNRLNEFINYSRPPEPRLGPVGLSAVVRDVQRALETDLTEKNVAFEILGPDVTVEADESLLRQVVFNLAINAVQSVEGGGRIEVRVAAPDRDEASLEVLDDGPGIPEDARETIFRPYYTTRAHGAGLGLTVVRQIATAHQWQLECLSPETGRGARFRLAGLKVVARPA